MIYIIHKATQRVIGDLAGVPLLVPQIDGFQPCSLGGWRYLIDPEKSNSWALAQLRTHTHQDAMAERSRRPQDEEICKHWASAWCNWEAQCSFAHPESMRAKARAEAVNKLGRLSEKGRGKGKGGDRRREKH